jgi:hypothetical protein
MALRVRMRDGGVAMRRVLELEREGQTAAVKPVQAYKATGEGGGETVEDGVNAPARCTLGDLSMS